MINKKEYPLLSTVDSPLDLKKVPAMQLPNLAEEMRRYIVEFVSQTGGHLASNLGAVELAIALHYVFDAPHDKIVWDVGHQAYAHKILTGRRDAMFGNRQYKGISGFPKREESPYDAFGVGHSSTSISATLGMAIADHLKGDDEAWHIAVIGDGALTGGMAIEALNHAGVYKKDMKFLIILNDNNCSISPPVGALSGNLGKLISTSPVWKARNYSKSVLKTVPGLWEVAKRVEKQTVNFLSPQSSIFSTFDLNYFGPIDGHDLPGLIHMLERLKSLEGPLGPMVLHISTIKGKGYKKAELNPTVYHGVNPFDPIKGVVSKPDPEHPSYTEVFSDWICDMGKKDSRLYAITPAMREGSGLVEFEKLFPDRYRDVAIAEQHAVTFAAGLAANGIKPVVAIYSTFAQRAYDQIVHDVATQNLPVLFAIDRGGIVGADGTTHHGIFDMAFLRCIPNMVVMAPSDEDECRKMLNTGFAMDCPCAVRYPRGQGNGTAVRHDFVTVPVGKSRLIRTGKAKKGHKIVIFSFGAMLETMRTVAGKFDATLVDMRFVKPLDREVILKYAKTHDLVVTAEEGVVAGGAGSGVLEVISDAGLAVKSLLVGVPDLFPAQGDNGSLMKECAMDAASIIEKIKSRLEG